MSPFIFMKLFPYIKYLNFETIFYLLEQFEAFFFSVCSLYSYSSRVKHETWVTQQLLLVNCRKKLDASQKQRQNVLVLKITKEHVYLKTALWYNFVRTFSVKSDVLYQSFMLIRSLIIVFVIFLSSVHKSTIQNVWSLFLRHRRGRQYLETILTQMFLW